MEYDLLGRVDRQSTGYWDDSETPALARVIEALAYDYDVASRLSGVTTERLDAGIDWAAPSYRTSYAQSWYDAANRQIASAELGALVSPPSRPSLPPASTDDILVTTVFFNDRGEKVTQTDPLGRENRSSYDDRARLIETIENYIAPGVPSQPTSGDNRIQRFGYTPDDQMTSLEIVFPNNQSQITLWKYGVVLGSSELASKRLLSAKVYADGSEEQYRYNRQSEIIRHKDPQNTVHEFHYDTRGRRIHDAVTNFGRGVIKSVKRISHTYDLRNLILTISSSSSADLGQCNIVNQVVREYDGYGQLAREYQEHAGKVVKGSFDKSWASRSVVFSRGGSNAA